MKTSSEQVKKKRGRKPKKKIETTPQPKKKRGRKKKAEADALQKSLDNYKPAQKVEFTSSSSTSDTTVNTVNFGNLPIQVQHAKPTNTKEFHKKLMEPNRTSLSFAPKAVEPTGGSRKLKNTYTVLFDGKEWPKTSPYACWWCCENFESMPLFLPTRYDDKLKRFEIKGNFCSLSCVKAYNLSLNDFGTSQRSTLIAFIGKKLYGFSNKPIKIALPRECLEKFGGKYSIQEFRDYSEDHTRSIILTTPDVIFKNPKITEL